jgi:hypothetical protein
LSETSNEIEEHIQNTRRNLSVNLGELEQRVRSAVDWRRQFKAHPATFLAAAFGAGLLLASRDARRKRRNSR